MNDRADRTIRELQAELAVTWSIDKMDTRYLANTQPHRDFTHAMLHVGKAAGKLMALCDELDHHGVAALPSSPAHWGKYIADLVVCAMRAANVLPGGAIDLQSVVQGRMHEKNLVTE